MWAFNKFLFVTSVILFFLLLENVQTTNLAKSDDSCKDSKIQKFIQPRYHRCLANKARLAELLTKINHVYCGSENPFKDKERWKKYEKDYQFLVRSPGSKTPREWYTDLSFYLASLEFLHCKYSPNHQPKLEVYKERAKSVVFAFENLRHSEVEIKVEEFYSCETENKQCLNQKFTMYYFWSYIQQLRYAIASKLKSKNC